MRCLAASTGTVLCLACVLLFVSGSSELAAQDREPIDIHLVVDFGADKGQNFGSLFEVRGADGQVVAGAGFLGAYNTQPRSDRHQLQVFVRGANASREWQIERLPDVPSDACGYYPFVLEGQAYLISRSGLDARVWRWDEASSAWKAADDVLPYTEQVGDGRLAVSSAQVTYKGRILLDLSGSPERIGNHYLAAGALIVRQYAATDPPTNRFVVYGWNPDVAGPLEEIPDARWELSMPNEFVFAFGQWENQVLAVTNYGAVLRYEGHNWKVLRSPVLNVSYQIYAALNFNERLLLGHYPTGEIYEYAGEQLRLLKGWPPRLPTVSPHARETQTLAIYGGDLYAGVWPWGEVWRYDRTGDQWHFVQRLFTHPAPTDATVHPYESETLAVDPVLNLWGQRVSGMAPLNGGLLLTTSSKSGQPWEAKFDFLTPEQRSDYGAVYLATLPGNLAASTRWTGRPRTFTFALTGDELVVQQDGQPLGRVPLDAEQLRSLRDGAITFGRGVYGPLKGKLLEAEATGLTASNAPTSDARRESTSH